LQLPLARPARGLLQGRQGPASIGPEKEKTPCKGVFLRKPATQIGSN